MQLSVPSRRRFARFLVAFYAATALLFFGFNTVFALGFFGTPSSWMNIGLFTIEMGVRSATWPTTLIAHEIHAALLLVGLGAGLVEPRLTGGR